jgi:methanogenic corrinoid protein MtbC1
VINWCCYCQRLIGESAPFEDFSLSHGICAACERRLLAGEDLKNQHQRTIDLFTRLFRDAKRGDRATCAALVEAGLSGGFAPSDLLLGLIQPALWTIGKAWEEGRATVAEEHRFTAWCTTAFSLLPPLPLEESASRPLELLMFQAPGNQHDLGLQFAERVLRENGVNCRAFVPELPAAEVLALTRQHAPRWLGFSCAMAESVEPLRALIDQLRGDGFTGGVLISGQAVRREVHPWGAGSMACRAVSDALSLITAAR